MDPGCVAAVDFQIYLCQTHRKWGRPVFRVPPFATAVTMMAWGGHVKGLH